MILGSDTLEIERKLRKHKKELEWNLDSNPHRWDSDEAKKANKKGHHWDSYEAKTAIKKRWKNNMKQYIIKSYKVMREIEEISIYHGNYDECNNIYKKEFGKELNNKEEDCLYFWMIYNNDFYYMQRIGNYIYEFNKDLEFLVKHHIIDYQKLNKYLSTLTTKEVEWVTREFLPLLDLMEAIKYLKK